ncbi:unnamed protein product [Dracunculus medinensis]|uniref:Gamma-glutamyltranspeptidase 1 n=1 Tax=Dracunculus medinensis TaxID=318479 RepID=A0A158Q5P8_DRAME|nr:unnamed protein product [Dracunculus medinensis]
MVQQDTDGTYKWAPPSNSYMAKYKRAAITSDHGICSDFGRGILLKGGNAIDATLASLFCLGATNPQSSGLGGGFIMTIYNSTTKRCNIIDARETAPKNSHQNMFTNNPNASKYGFLAIATPGELYGYWLAYTKYGSGNVTWSEIIQPTIDLCKNGVPVSEFLANVLKVKEKQFKTLPYMRNWINNATDRVYIAGDLIKRTKLARTLERISRSSDPVELFYRGDMANTIIKEIQANGGILNKEDLMNFKPVEHDEALINDHFSGSLVMCGPPPPSSFAVSQLIVSIMAKFYSPESNKDLLYKSPEFYHRLIEAEKFSYAKRTLLGDELFVKEASALAKNMTTKLYTDWIYALISDKAHPSDYYGAMHQAQKEDHGTSHVSTLDAQDNAVSATSTVNRWFGSSTESEELGIIWNDEMDDFSTPGMINGFGFAPSKTNFIKPGKKPMSSMSPMVIYDSITGKVKMVIGASGGSKIISAIAKPVIRTLFFNETIKEAIDAPLLHNQFTPDFTQYENHVPQELMKILVSKYNQKFRLTSGFEGIVQAIYVDSNDDIYVNGDFRRKTDMHPGGY